MPAFERAVELGYRYLETDVHVTADGVVVAFHDDDLSRTCGRPGRISELPWSEVATARVDGREPIPRLDELLGAWPDIRWNIDCKADRAADPLADELARAKILDRVCVSAFSDRRLLRLRRRLGDGLCSGAGPAELAALRLIGWTWPGPLAAQVPVSRGRLTVVDERFVERAHRRGIHVHVWTIDDPAEMSRLLDLGVDGIMTDRPAVLRDVLSRVEARGADGRSPRSSRPRGSTLRRTSPSGPASTPHQVGVGPGHGETDAPAVDGGHDAERATGARPAPPGGDDGDRGQQRHERPPAQRRLGRPVGGEAEALDQRQQVVAVAAGAAGAHPRNQRPDDHHDAADRHHDHGRPSSSDRRPDRHQDHPRGT